MDYFGRLSGAEGETRTPTPERELDPEPSVSTNSTTSARKGVIKDFAVLGKFFLSKKSHSHESHILGQAQFRKIHDYGE